MKTGSCVFAISRRSNWTWATMNKLKSVAYLDHTFEVCARNERSQLKYRSLGRHKKRMGVNVSRILSHWLAEIIVWNWPSPIRFLVFELYSNDSLIAMGIISSHTLQGICSLSNVTIKVATIKLCRFLTVLHVLIVSIRLCLIDVNLVLRALFPGNGSAIDGSGVGRDFSSCVLVLRTWELISCS